MRIALVHDALNQIGGAEYILRAFSDMFPHAPIYSLINDQKVSKLLFRRAEINTSFLQKLPGGVKHYRWYLPIHPIATEHIDLSGYDLVISDCSAFSKGVITKPETIHICYCHTPTRFLWHDTHNYTEDLHQNRIVKKFLPIVLNRLRIWDQLAAQRVDKFIANSQETARRIKKYYKRNAVVINPPVQWDKFYISKQLGDFYLIVQRLRPYKKIDLAIKAFNRLGLPLVVVGTGEEQKHLKRLAGPNITFLGNITDQQKYWLFSRCQAFINPQEEDFGIAACEAMASGRPVIAYNKGGALETVKAGLSGVFFSEQSEEALIDTLRAFNSDDYDPQAIREYAKRFDAARFEQQIWQMIMNTRRVRAQLSLPVTSLNNWALPQKNPLEVKWP